MLGIALQEARTGLAEGGIPIGAAIFDSAASSSAPDTTAACNRAIPRSTAKPMPSATPDASAVIAT